MEAKKTIEKILEEELGAIKPEQIDAIANRIMQELHLERVRFISIDKLTKPGKLSPNNSSTIDSINPIQIKL